MKIKIQNKDSNYLCKIVCLSNLRKHPNADRLQIATIDFCNVITGLTAKEGDYYVYFPVESQIDGALLTYTNSFDDPTLNRDKEVKGFFTSKRRVKAVKLRGVPSQGYIIPLREFINCYNLSLTSSAALLADQDFDTLEVDGKDILICQKYIPGQPKKSQGPSRKLDKKIRKTRLIDGQFRFHQSTSSVHKNLHKIMEADRLTITYKLHGTSIVVGNLLVNKPLKWYEKILKKLGVNIVTNEYGIVYSSRSVIKNQYYYPKSHNHFYTEDIWGIVAKELTPHIEPGITLYGEIVGYTPSGRAIQKGYDYGCDVGKHHTYIYRITYTSPVGTVYEFTHGQIENYCILHGLTPVPILDSGTPNQLVDTGTRIIPEEVMDNHGKFVWLMTDRFLERKCNMCKNDVPAEGIVVRIEEGLEFNAYKLKSFSFLERETKQLDAEEIDIETSEEQI